MDKKKYFILACAVALVGIILNAVAISRTAIDDVIETTVVKEKTSTGIVYDVDDTQRVEIKDADAATEDVDYFIAEDAKTIEGQNVNHSVFAAGDILNFNVKGLNGLLFAAGGTLNIRESIDYGFIAGNAVMINGTIKNDLFAAGSNVQIDEDASVRDAYLVAQSVSISGNVAGNVKAAGAYIKIEKATIYGDVNLAGASIELGKDVVINGKLTYNEDATLIGLDDAKEYISEIESYRTLVQKDGTTTALMIVSGALITMASMMFFAAFIDWVKPKTYNNAIENKNFWANLGRGFVAMVIWPVVSVLLMIVPALTAVGVVSMLVYVIVLMAATAPAVMQTGHYVMEKIFKQKKAGFYTDATVGAVVWAVLGLIPILGALVICVIEIANFGMLAFGVKDDIKDSHSKVHKKIA